MWLELTDQDGGVLLVNMDRVVLVTAEADGSRLHVSLPESRAHNGISILVREAPAIVQEKLKYRSVGRDLTNDGLAENYRAN